MMPGFILKRVKHPETAMVLKIIAIGKKRGEHMNIGCRLSALIRKIEKHYQRENLPGSKYLIIKRECENSGLGLFAYYVTMLAQIEYALRNGMIPVIDMKNYANTFHREGEVGKVNTWELFWSSPVVLQWRRP